MSALIGALRVSLSAETANFEAGMKRAQRTTATSASAIQKSMGLIKTSIAGLAAGLSVGMFVHAIKDALEYAGSLTELAETLGLTAKDLQTFSYAAGQVGISQEELQVGIQKLTISMGKAQLGAKAQADAFKAIGISVDQLKGKDTGEVFRMIAEKLEKVTDRSQRAAVEVALFGKAGAKLDNLLSGAEGRLNDLSDAAEKLGIVLSDEQIKHADETADKLHALATVLKANVAGAVADNADAILGLGNALAFLVRKAGEGVSGLRLLYHELKAYDNALGGDFKGYTSEMNAAKAIQYGGIAYGVGSVSMKLPPAKPKPGAASGGTDIGKFLAPGDGKPKKAKEDHSAEDALRRANEFDQDIRRAQMDVLQATQDLATDYVERTSIGIEILNAEKAAFDAEQKYQVSLFELTKGKDGLSKEQAAQLKLEYDKTDALKRQALLDEEQAQRRQDIAMLVQTDFDTQKDKLQSELQLATTAKEQRDIQLKLLDLSYRQERARLEAVLADEKASDAAKEDARRRLLGLNQTHANDRQGVINSTRNPLEAWAATVPQTADQITEALQGIEANGLDGIAGAIAGIVSGSESMGEAFQQVAKQMIAEITAIIIKMLLLKAIQAATSAFGGGGMPGMSGVNIGDSAVAGGASGIDMGMIAGLPHMATGGSMRIGGIGGTDRNTLSLNGLPIARVSRGEGLHIVPNGGGMGGGPVINFHINGNPTRETMNQMAARTRSALAGANRAGV